MFLEHQISIFIYLFILKDQVMFKTGIMDAENFGFEITRINYILKYI